MANILEYTLSLNDRITGKLTKIGIANDQQLATWAKVQSKVVQADTTLKKCGVSLGGLRERVAALRAEREWIPATNINAIRRSNIETKALEKQIRQLENVNGGKIKSWFNNLKTSIPIVGALTNPLMLLGGAIYKVSNYVRESEGAWLRQTESETKLAAVMRNTMGAGQEEVKSILELASAQQRLGVIGDEVQLSGTQELSTYLTKSANLKKLMPVMNDMLAQQYGMNATQEQAINIASMMGKVMDGQVGALSRYGYKFDAAQEKILKYGTESQRAATLADVVSGSVGGVNEALANTPEGKLKQHANTMGDLQEKIGRLYTQVKASLLPVFEWFSGRLENTVTWLESNRDTILTLFNTVAQVIQGAFTLIWDVISGVIDAVGWWVDKLRDGNVVVILVTGLLTGLAGAMAIVTIRAKLLALWSNKVAIAKGLWATVSGALNLSLLANPVTWIVLGIIALIAVITYLCYKIDGWRSLWDGVIGFMKYTFMAYVDYVKLFWGGLVHGIMIGLDKIKLGWYKFKEACGIGDSAENQAAIAQINADVEARQKAIVDGAKSMIENARKAKDSLAGIKMSWNSDRSLSDVASGLKAKLGIETPAIPGMNPTDGGGQGSEGGGGAGSDTASAIATGGTRSTTINISLKSLVENIIYQGGYEGNREALERDLESSLLRILQMAYSAQ